MLLLHGAIDAYLFCMAKAAYAIAECLHVSIACPCSSYQNAAMRERRKDPEVRESEVS